MTEPSFTDDLAYVAREYLTLEQPCGDRAQTPEQVRGLVAAGDLPGPAYELPDGTQMFPPT